MFRVLVNRLRAYNYASVSVINNRGSVIPQDYPIVVKFPFHLTDCVTDGSVWEVDGTWDFRTYLAKAGKEITEKICILSVAKPICPEGQALAVWIEKNITGIGEATAIKLTRGIKDLNSVVLAGDIDTLLRIDGMSASKAHALMMGWPEPEIYDSICFLNNCGLPPRLADPITKIYGRNTEKLIREDPYILVPLGIPFAEVENIITKLGITVSTESRESALAEDIVHTRSMNGSTVVSLKYIKQKALSMGYEVSDNVAEYAVKLGTLISVGDGYQTIGMARMEAVVGHSISEFLDRSKEHGTHLAEWEKLLTDTEVSRKLTHYESAELGFRLTSEQRSAVIGSALSPVSCISGGAGVGKTTIIKAIIGVYQAFEPNGLEIKLMAISGRAAMRMKKSTGLPAVTISKFIYDNIRRSKKSNEKSDQYLIVIDEASMVDLHSMYQLICILPTATRIIFIGDTAQLPPVGCGLVFHEIIKTRVPTYHLTAVKRQNEYSGIHKLATYIRKGEATLALSCLAGLNDVIHHTSPTLEFIYSVWESEGGAKRSIILTPTNIGHLGVDNINSYIQKQVGLNRQRLHHMDKDGVKLPWRIKGRYLHINDQVMVTENDYAKGIRNGELATITQIFDDCSDGVYGVMELDGQTIEIDDNVISKLDLGYAVTIHKSQGSQWDTVILVLSDGGVFMTDRSLLYTAVTRPEKKLFLFGDKNLINSAIKSGNLADKRIVGLSELVGNDSEKNG